MGRMEDIMEERTRNQRSAGFRRLGVVVLTLACGSAAADPTLVWCEVGAPGNRGVRADEFQWWANDDPDPGAVSYTFRITQTEVLSEQWASFVNAYSPYWTGHPNDIGFASPYLYRDDGGTYRVRARAERVPIIAEWTMAARYCNWLHNGMSGERWAFESGAYDASTFTFNPDGSGNHQRERSPGAKYWIPSLDEMLKASFYDPDRYGEGQGGYWLYPQGSNAPPIPGLPQNGGTTNTGQGLFNWYAGMYPDAQSPWGLLDVSGGQSEWVETAFADRLQDRFRFGSQFGGEGIWAAILDRGDYWDAGGVGGVLGFRVAGLVPTPASAIPLLLLWYIGNERRRRS